MQREKKTEIITRYVSQKEKTLWEERQLVTGWNCTAQSALSEMHLAKERFRKTDGRQYYRTTTLSSLSVSRTI